MKFQKKHTHEAQIVRHQVRYITVSASDHGRRLDNILIRIMPSLPRGRIYQMIRKGEIRLDKKRARPKSRVRTGMLLRLPPYHDAPKTHMAPSQALVALLKKAVVYEDVHWLVINKPGGLAVHGGSGLKTGLIEALRYIRREDDYLELAHRIDRHTSGLLLIAKKPAVLKYAHACFRERKVEKVYHAMVSGRWLSEKDAFHLDLTMAPTIEHGEKIMHTDPQGKHARSHIQRVSSWHDRYHLLRIRPKTGRMHQIRVQCATLQLPIIGDPKYGEKSVNEQFQQQHFSSMFLHASELKFYDQNNQLRHFSCPLPQGFTQCIEHVNTI